MSTLKVNKLRDTAGSADAITLDPNGGAVIAGVTTVSTVKVGSGVTITSDGDIFHTGVCTATSFSGEIPAASIVGVCTSGLTKTGGFGGITVADQWYVTSNFTGNTDPVQNNLSRFTSAGNLGSAMTVSSGIWTFPSTGFWKIDVSAQVYRASGNQNAYAQWRTILSTDNFSSNFVGATADCGYFDNYGATRFAGGCSSVIFDVTNVSTHKLKFKTNVEDNCTWSGDATNPHTLFQFVRLGDT